MRKQGKTPKIFIEPFLVVGKLVSHEAYFFVAFFSLNELRKTEVLDMLEQWLRTCRVISFACQTTVNAVFRVFILGAPAIAIFSLDFEIHFVKMDVSD